MGNSIINFVNNHLRRKKKSESALSKLPQLAASYLQAFEQEDGDVAGRQTACDYLASSTALYKGHVVPMGFIPKIYDTAALKSFDCFAQATYAVLEKITRRYLENEDFRKLFGFAPELERLICLPTGYNSLIPIMRMDIFLNEESMEFTFCEFNTDGTSAMNEDREGSSALSLSPTFRRATQSLDLQPQELFESWIDEFLAIYASSEQGLAAAKVGDADSVDGMDGVILQPQVAILDYTQSASMQEFEEFRRRFEKRGIPCAICDVTSLSYTNNTLYGTDIDPGRAAGGAVKIDLIYRRAVTGEILADLLGSKRKKAKLQGAHALVQAVEDKSVCMIGGFVTHVAHSKKLLAVMCNPQCAEFFDKDELLSIRKHLPYTTIFDDEPSRVAGVKINKDARILKPEDGYASQGVYAGLDYEQAAWEKIVDKCAGKKYIVQSYCDQYATPNIVTNPTNPANPTDAHSDMRSDTYPTALEPWNNLTGLYLYNGRFSGVYVRAGRKGIIVGFAGGITVPVFYSAYQQDGMLVPRTRTL